VDAIYERAEPDRLDGELVERNVGSIPHSGTQVWMLVLLSSIEGYSAYPAVTMEITPTRFRTADVALFVDEPWSHELYPKKPPEIAIEILEEEDRFVHVWSKLQEYYAWGVNHVWLIDPWNRKLAVYDSTGLHDVSAFVFKATITAAEIFAED
jgi:Uma2 family endonuclease